MEKDLVFFTDGILTDTKANSIANFAKLAYTDLEEEINSISFITSTIETIDGNNAKDLSIGVTDLSNIPDKIERIGNLKALCAWLREGIAAHQRVIKEVQNISFDKWMKDNGITLPEKPYHPMSLTEDEVVADFDIKKRNRYYSLEAHASTIGGFIHKNGSIDKARKTFYARLNKQRETSGEGVNTIIYSYYPSVDSKDIEQMFYTLQQMQTKYQSELNAIKAEIKSRITNYDIEKNKEFELSNKAYCDEESKAFNQYQSWKSEELKRVSAYKIGIPNQLKSIFEEVANKGKE